MSLTRWLCKVEVSIAVALLGACGGGGGGGGTSSTPPPDLAGVWAGSWTGSNSAQGPVTGTWEAELSQNGLPAVTCLDPLDGGNLVCSRAGVTGTATLRGDVDCMDGVIDGIADASNASGAAHRTVGSLDRSPCGLNRWALTALNLDNHSASGVWDQLSTNGRGTLTGARIARPGGPRIRFVYPPSGRPGALVTIVGNNFAPLVADNALQFNASAATVLTANTSRLTTRVPNVATSGSLFLTTLQDLAISPIVFNMDVSYPEPVSNVAVTTGGGAESVVISPDGRRAYVANNVARTVSMVNTATNTLIISTSPGGWPKTLAFSPDGRWVYATAATGEILILDAGTGALVDTIPVLVGGVSSPVGAGTAFNPHGLAVSPDGRILYASQNQDGGAVVVVNIAARSVVASVSLGAGWMPLGIAVHPDGEHAYFAFADVALSGPGIIKVFDAVTMTDTATTYSVGVEPVGLLVTPDGTKLYVTNRISNSVSVIGLAPTLTRSIPVGLAPLGLAISPDRTRVHVANNASNTISVIDAATDAVLGSPIAVGNGPAGIAISADGLRGYAANAGSGSVSELGGALTLTIAKGGNGIGRVVSNPPGIDCGTSCQAHFRPATLVQLTAIPESGSTFSGWSGDPDCLNPFATMTANRSCTANFQVVAPPSGCFIATAAFGSEMAEEVRTLRQFRDRYLLTNAIGAQIVHSYYRYSPPLADVLRQHEAWRTAVRWGLWPLVFSINHPAGACGLALLCAALFFRFRRRRHAQARNAASHCEFAGIELPE